MDHDLQLKSKPWLGSFITTQRSVSDTKLCQGLDVRSAVHINTNPPLLQLSRRN